VGMMRWDWLAAAATYAVLVLAGVVLALVLR
jgi:hypothetical protein